MYLQVKKPEDDFKNLKVINEDDGTEDVRGEKESEEKKPKKKQSRKKESKKKENSAVDEEDEETSTTEEAELKAIPEAEVCDLSVVLYNRTVSALLGEI